MDPSAPTFACLGASFTPLSSATARELGQAWHRAAADRPLLEPDGHILVHAEFELAMCEDGISLLYLDSEASAARAATVLGRTKRSSPEAAQGRAAGGIVSFTQAYPDGRAARRAAA